MSLNTELIQGLSPGEAAERTGLSIDTLRYYERIGLLAPVRRTGGGRRIYSEGDVAWIGLLTCLRRAGMGITDLQRFVGVLRGDSSSQVGPVELLETHRDSLLEHIAQMQAALGVLEDKLVYYRARQVSGG